MRPILPLVLLVTAAACATLTPEGAGVRVYEADLSAPASARALPAGCRLVAPAEEPVNQMESERQVSDPYRLQRNAAGEKGGNVLLVLSRQILARPKLDCAIGDTSPECVSRGENWYRVAFESYACDAPALLTLASLPAEPRGTGGANLWPFGGKKSSSPPAAPSSPPAPAAAPTTPAPRSPSLPTPAELKAKVLALMREGVGTDLIVAYVRQLRVAAPLSAEEIIDWKRSGIAEPVIEAAITPR